MENINKIESDEQYVEYCKEAGALAQKSNALDTEDANKLAAYINVIREYEKVRFPPESFKKYMRPELMQYLKASGPNFKIQFNPNVYAENAIAALEKQLKSSKTESRKRKLQSNINAWKSKLR